MHTITVARESFLLWVLSITSSIYIIANDREKTNMLIVCWAATACLIVILHKEFFGYHYVIIYPPLAIASGYGIKKIIQQKWIPLKLSVLKDPTTAVLLLAVVANIVIYASLNYKHNTRFLRYYAGLKSTEWYYSHFSAYPEHEYSFPGNYEVAEFLKNNASPDDMLFTLGGIESVLHVLTGLKSPSRFVYSWFLFTTERSNTKIAQKYRNELLNDLKNKAPKYIVSIGSVENYKSYREFYNFIQNSYKHVKTFTDDRYLFIRNI
jgi:hypothetical protein